MNIKNNTVLVVGSIAVDWLEMPDDRKGEAVGGSAIYFTLSASAYSSVHVVGIVGTDFPDKGMFLLKTHAGNLDDLQIVNGDTFSWGGRYHSNWDDRTTLFTKLGVFENFKPKLSPVNTSVPYIFLGNIQPSLQLEVLKQIENPELVICDTMNLWIETTRSDLDRVLEQVNVLLINSSEATLLTDQTDPVSAAHEIMKSGPKVVVIKLGSKGAILATGSKVIKTGVYPVSRVTDPTGAGDSFAGGFVGGLAAGQSYEEALISGSAVASFCVEGFGTAGLEKMDMESVLSRRAMIRESVSISQDAELN